MAAIHRQNQAGAAAKAMLANTNATASSQAAAANGHQNTRGRGESKDTRWQRDGGILGAIGLNAIFSDPNKDKFKREHKASVVFLVKRIEFQADEDNVCQLEELATQFFILLGFNTSATIANMIFVACFTDQNEERSPDGWREFILSQEYVELVYRQFLVHLGFLLAPMMALFAVMATILEYGCDKYRLLRICHKPKATKSSFRGVLAFYFFLSALFVMFSFPNGAVFVLAAKTAFQLISVLFAYINGLSVPRHLSPYTGSFGLADSDTCFIYQ
eukprot:jgi/Bigna1/137900/aug1.41_g12608